jgi:hypothetical protein
VVLGAVAGSARAEVSADAPGQQASDPVLAWARGFGLVTGAAEEDRLLAMRLGALATLVVPEADAAERDLTAQWAAFVCLVDDRFDHSGLGSRPQEARALFGRLLDVLTADGAPGHRSGFEAALDDLWRRTSPRMPVRWRERFIADYRDFALATCAEAAGRRDRTRLALGDYLVLRRRTITALPMADIVESTAGAPWPDLPDGHARFTTVRQAVADVAGWTNDLVSAEGDLRTGQDNLVTVWAREHRCSLSAARLRVTAMRDNRLRTFSALAAALAAGDGVPGPQREPVRRYVEALESFVAATLHWLGVTGRFEARWLPDCRSPFTGPAPT